MKKCFLIYSTTVVLPLPSLPTIAIAGIGLCEFFHLAFEPKSSAYKNFFEKIILTKFKLPENIVLFLCLLDTNFKKKLFIFLFL